MLLVGLRLADSFLDLGGVPLQPFCLDNFFLSGFGDVQR